MKDLNKTEALYALRQLTQFVHYLDTLDDKTEWLSHISNMAKNLEQQPREE